MPRAAWALAALLALAGLARPALAQSAPTAPSAPGFDSNSLGTPPPEDATPTPTRRTNRPPDVLGAPVLGAPVRSASDNPPARPGSVTPVSFPETTWVDQPRRGVGLGAPDSAGNPVSARVVEPAARTTPAVPAADPVNDLLTNRSTHRDRRDKSEEQSSGKFGDRIGEALGNTGDWFRSDHVFDGFISPVTNPFLFEDPRSLTEVRPIFIYQKIPTSQPDFKGGNVWFFGTQARVAFTDRLSFTFNKIGGISVNPGSGSSFDGQTGFAELWLGPKYTIIRNEESGSLLAGGLQFQVPVGSKDAFQHTGSLSLVPYLTYGQNFCRDFRIGSFNALVGTGYSVATDSQRSDYFFLSGHLDLDVNNSHKFYPLVEMNWFQYTKDGRALPIGSEGRDLFNFGGQAKGRGLLTGAIGARYKISESAQLGAAFEAPLAGPRDLFRYRFTLDFILRY